MSRPLLLSKRSRLFQLTQKAQKLTELPDRKLLCIMTMIEEKGKDASVLMCN